MLGAAHLDVVLTGGHMRNATGTIAGMIAKDVLDRFRFQKGFLGAWGLTPEDGLDGRSTGRSRTQIGHCPALPGDRGHRRQQQVRPYGSGLLRFYGSKSPQSSPEPRPLQTL